MKPDQRLIWPVVVAFVMAGTSLRAADPFKDVLQPIFKSNCIKCHGQEGKKVKGKVNLFKLASAADLKAKPELIRDMIDALDEKEMPPEKEPPLDPAKRRAMIAKLQQLLHEAVSAQKTYPQAPIRRMNRFQYNNAVTDLLDIKVAVFQLPEKIMRSHSNYFNPKSGKMPKTVKVGNRPLGKSQLIERRLGGVAAFPQDLRAEHGYDNQADHLSLSPLLMESFLKLSRSVVNSRDFGPKTCGVWKELFVPPAKGQAILDAVRSRLRGFLSRAFRRPVDETTLDRYTKHVLGRIKAGERFTEAMKVAVSAVLASPRFLYLYERGGKSEVEPIDDFELASRLSFFLWGSIPDQQLLDLAAKGKLHNDTTLGAQVDRMLNDPKLKRFCDSFPSQWLQLERVISAVPDPKLFKSFYFHSRYRATMHMALEPLLLFETVLIENRPITELIDAKFTYRSSILNNWFKTGKGKGGVGPVEFTRVPLTDRREGGVITNPAVMTMTSGTMRTKPITRGAWIVTVVFNSPPKPPPADVPTLPETKADLEKLTLRERLDAHRKRADCKGCHAKIDPFGFAMENYGPTGVWRQKYRNGRDVDSAGVLFRKHKFANVVEFKDAILAEKDRFARGFAKHLLTFSLGREMKAADSPALDKIVSGAKAAEYRLRPMIRQVVLSKSFRHKYNPKVGAKP